MFQNCRSKTFEASEAIARYRVVQPTTTEGQVAYPASGVTMGELYVTLHAAASGESVTCIPLQAASGNVRMSCAAAVALGARVGVSGASGQIDDSSGPTIGTALEAATAADEEITVAPSIAGERLLYASVADSAEISNTVTETAFDKSITIDGTSLKVGDVLEILAAATLNSTNATDTLTLRLKVGTETIIATAAVDVADGDVGYIHAFVTVRAVGASGALQGSGVQGLGVPGTVTAKPFVKAQAAEDLSGGTAVTVTAEWSVANAGNKVELTQLAVKHHRA